jgi:hypothetical protein
MARYVPSKTLHLPAATASPEVMKMDGEEIKDESLYVCMRVADLPKPYVPCLRGKCKKCKEEVYYSKYVYENDAVIKKIIDSGNLLCVNCASETVKETDKLAVADLTAAEVVDYFKRRENVAG